LQCIATDRPIAVDWALEKTKYEAAIRKSVVEEQDDVDDLVTKMRAEAEKGTPAVKVKQEPKEGDDDDDDGEDRPKGKKKRHRNPHRSRGGKLAKLAGSKGGGELDESVVKVEADEEEEEDGSPKKKKIKFENADEEHSDDDEEENEHDEEEQGENEGATKSNKKLPEVSRDVRMGLTVFVDNVAFTANEDDLAEFMADKFGPVKYALFCLDPVTQHPRGTAFVQFMVSWLGVVFLSDS
jgi:hypothetical protein